MIGNPILLRALIVFCFVTLFGALAASSELQNPSFKRCLQIGSIIGMLALLIGFAH